MNSDLRGQQPSMGSATSGQPGGIEYGADDARIIATHSFPHFIQSEAWAAVRRKCGWKSQIVSIPRQSGAPWNVREYRRTAPGLGRVTHIPRASGIEVADVEMLTSSIRNRHAGFLAKLELYQPRDEALLEEFLRLGWKEARGTQYEHTVVMDLAGGPEELQQRMKKRNMSHIRRAIKNEVEVRRVEPTEENYQTLTSLLGITEDRSGAYFHPEWYYRATWDELVARDQGRLYFAYYEGKVVAGLFAAVFADGGWYKDGGSIRLEKRVDAPHLMQLRTAEDLQREGFGYWELGNIPDPNGESASMQGLGQFKRGFSNETVSLMPPLELEIDSRAKLWAPALRVLQAVSLRTAHIPWM